MDLTDLITQIYCLCDDYLLGKKLRRGGFSPKLHDSEVLAIELSGELLGIDTDAELYRHFRQHHASLFPALLELHRTTFLRQPANLWAVKHHLSPWLRKVLAHTIAVLLCQRSQLPFAQVLRPAVRMKRVAHHAD